MTSPQTSPQSSLGRRPLLNAGVAVAVVLALLLVPGRYPGRIVSVIYDLSHAPVFAGLVFVVIRALGGRRPSWRLAISSAIAIVAVGCLGEVLQHFAGRSARVDDAIANAVGVGIGLFAAMWGQILPARRRRICVSLIAITGVAHTGSARVLLDIVRQNREIPVLGSFENELELIRWAVLDARISRSTQHATHGNYSLELALDPGPYPGCALRSPPGDWSDYEWLEFDVYARASSCGISRRANAGSLPPLKTNSPGSCSCPTGSPETRCSTS